MDFSRLNLCIIFLRCSRFNVSLKAFGKFKYLFKNFLWLTFKDSILSKDYLVHRGWTGDERCRFCSYKETIDHLFFGCSVAKYVWNVISCALDCNVMPGKIEELYDWILPFRKWGEAGCGIWSGFGFMGVVEN